MYEVDIPLRESDLALTFTVEADSAVVAITEARALVAPGQDPKLDWDAATARAAGDAT